MSKINSKKIKTENKEGTEKKKRGTSQASSTHATHALARVREQLSSSTRQSRPCPFLFVFFSLLLLLPGTTRLQPPAETGADTHPNQLGISPNSV
jgi:hypothetical protein